MGNGDGPPGTVGVVAPLDRRRHDLERQPRDARAVQQHHLELRGPPRRCRNLIYASSVSGEVYRSTDGGASWQKLAREFGEIRALAWTP